MSTTTEAMLIPLKSSDTKGLIDFNSFFIFPFKWLQLNHQCYKMEL